jgi:predicted component of type VI protein secretion system
VIRSKKQPRSLYADLFAEHELKSLERTADNPLLQDEIGLLRMLIRRIAAQMLNAEDDEQTPADKIKAVKELTDILLNALKARHQISPRGEDNLTEAMRQVIAEIETLDQQADRVQEEEHAE